MVHWIRIHLPMQGTRVQSLVQENPHIPHATEQLSLCAATKPVCLNYRVRLLQLLSPRAAINEARAPTACAPQQEKPPQRDTCALRRRVATSRHS